IEKNGRMVDVHRPPFDVHRGASQRGERATMAGGGTTDTTRPQPAGTGSRLHPGVLAPAQGRVERSFQTAQDSLVKQLRLAKISTLKDGNEYLEQHYWPEWNDSFALPVKDFPDCHRPLGGAQDLATILCHAEERAIANDYSFSFAG